MGQKENYMLALSKWAVGWWLFAIVTITVAVLADTIWSDPLLPMWSKSILFAQELSFTTIALVACVLPGAVIARVIGVRSGVVVTTILIFTGILFIVASWQSFSLLGTFLDSYALAMVRNDGSQILQHVVHAAPRQLGLSVGIAIGLLVLLGLSSSLLTRLSECHKLFLNRFTFVVLLSIFFVGAVGRVLIFNSDVQIVDERKSSYSLAEYASIASIDKVGPFSKLKHDVEQFFGSSDVFISENVKIERNLRITPQDYANQFSHESKNHNVVLILIESLRGDQIPAFGGETDVMPTVQKLADRGWVFSNAYSTASHSNYADLPPLSSHYPLRSERTHFYPENPRYPRVLIYDLLKLADYRTGIFSSQNENWGGMLNYLDTGSLDELLHAETWKGSLRQDAKLVGEGIHDWLVKAKRSGKIDDADTASAAIEWLQSDQTKPFFMYMNFQNSHWPYSVPPEYEREFVSEDDPLLEKLKATDITNMPVEFVKRAYSDSLRYIDNQFARVLKQLEDDGRLENTIFIISADTAMRADSQMLGNGGKLFEEVVNVPLLIAGPGIDPQQDTRFVSHMDIPPTILESLKLPPHPAFQGRSLLDGAGDSTIYLVAQTPVAQQYAIIKDGWKLLWDEKTNKNVLTQLESSDTQPDTTAVAQNLAEYLHTWIGLQIDYYDNLGRYSDTYPPVIITNEQQPINQAQAE